MKLQHLRVEQLRQFRQPLEIAGFAPGINLFIGPNESGKSTLVRAIRAAFFERHRSSSVDDLQPWGDSSATPKVSLTFDCQGHRWQLHKSFLRQKRCDLQVDDASFSSDEAEEKLAELLGFQFPGRGASKAEHWGIPGLLWIEQGDGHNVRAAVEYAGDYLKSALGGSLGEIASSAGDEVMVQVERERAALLTGTGRPTGEYAKAIEQLDVLQSLLRTLDDKIAVYRQQVDRLGELRKQQTQDETECPWEIYRQQAQQARDQLDEVNGWIARQQREEQELKSCRAQLGLVREQLARYQVQADELQTRAQQDEAARAEVNRQHERQPAIQASLQAARVAYEQARQAVQGARQNERRQSMQRDRQQLVERLQEIDGHLIKARQLQLELHDLRAELQAHRIDPKSLKQLQKKQSELDTLRIRQQTIATRLHFELLPGQQLRLNDEAISGQTERLLLSEAEMEIAGLGRIQIQPGGDEVAELARQQQRCQDALSAGLQVLSIASVAEAEQRAQRYQTLQKELEGKEALLATVAPQGLDALQGEQQSADTRCRQLDEQLAALPASTGQAPSLASAEAQLEATEQQLRNTEQEESDSRQAMALAERTAATTAQELVRMRSELQSPDRQQKAQQAQQQLIDLRADDERLHASVGKLQQQIDAARPDILRQDIARLDSTATGLEKAAAQRKLEIAALQASVQTQGAEGLEELRSERALAFERAQQRRDQLVRRADALDLLRDLLRAQREALTRRLQAPLQRHLDRYLQLLFPQGRLSVDDHLIPHQLIRPAGQEQEVGDLDALSFGSREQMGLISRLAYADLLKDAGRPTLIILDDALVHSDAQRLDQMKRILFDAGQRHQILLFTCHPQNWRDLGVAARELRQESEKIDP